MNSWQGLTLRFWPVAWGVGLIGLAMVAVVAGCHEQEQTPQLMSGELSQEPTPDPRCQAATESANEGVAQAAEARYDRAVEALSRALLSCESPPFQQARKADLVRVLRRWSEASQAEGNLDRALFLQDALLTLEPTSQHQLAYVDALIATRRLALARQRLDELNKRANASIGPALEQRS
ncbi:MAG: hypothetical protein V2A73_09485, partial [Pseudomonadota bacterium]